jgi:quercetin dioxygenase-like cupin family protein
MSHTAEAYIYQAGEGEVRWMGETRTCFLATGPLTDGAFALVEERAIRGETVPLHAHDDDGEAFYVLAGEVSFFIGDQSGRRVTTGGFVHLPRGTVHGFRIDSAEARYLILTTARHAEFYRAITLPEPHSVITDAVIEQACREYGVTFVGPLPA